LGDTEPYQTFRNFPDLLGGQGAGPFGATRSSHPACPSLIQRGKQLTLRQGGESFVDIHGPDSIRSATYLSTRPISRPVYGLRSAKNNAKQTYDTKSSMASKNRAAVELGRRGGKARARKLTPEQRTEAARKAVAARWAKQRELVSSLSKGTKELLRAVKAREAAQGRGEKPRREKAR
jgi:hypothetical protein